MAPFGAIFFTGRVATPRFSHSQSN